MKLFWMELKKLFTWPVIVIVILLNLLLFKLLVEFELDYFPNGRPAIDIFQVEGEMIDKYGEVIDEEEFADFRATYVNRVEQAEEYLRNNNELAIQSGVDSYEEFRKGVGNDKEIDQVSSHIMFELEEDLFWELQAREGIMERYEARVTDLENAIHFEPNSKQELKRIKDMLSNEKFQYYDGQVIENFYRYASQVLAIVLISIAIVLSPIYIRDKMRAVIPLQYTSKKGRRTFQLKWRAGLTAIGILLMIHLLIYGGLYLTNDTSPYFFMHVYSMSYQLVWYDITFGEFILLTVAAMIVIGYVFGILTMACSALVANYMTQIGTQIVIFCAFVIVVIPIGIHRMIWTIYLPWIVPAIYLFLIATAFFLNRYVKRRELVRDI